MGLSPSSADSDFPTDTAGTSVVAVMVKVQYGSIRHGHSLHGNLCCICSIHATRLVVAWKTLVSLG